jgi:hypothetical protein
VSSLITAYAPSGWDSEPSVHLVFGAVRVHGSVFQPSPKRRLVDDQDELEEP